MENQNVVEEWKDIEDWKGYYQISNRGRVKSLARIIMRSNGYPQTWPERILKQAIDSKGYPMVGFSKNDKHKTMPIHRLLAEHWMEKIEGKNEINHKDSNRRNYNLDNLEFCTHSENMKHAYKFGSVKLDRPFGENHHETKFKNTDVIEIRKLYLTGNFTLFELANRYKVSQKTISNIVNRKIWKHIK